MGLSVAEAAADGLRAPLSCYNFETRCHRIHGDLASLSCASYKKRRIVEPCGERQQQKQTDGVKDINERGEEQRRI